MEPTAVPLPNLPWSLPWSYALKLSGRLIIAKYLTPKVLGGYSLLDPGVIEEGVDVFGSANPAALLFLPASRTGHGKMWGYFYGHYPIDDVWVWPVPGGCWRRYGPEKGYFLGRGGAMEAVAFRRRFAFYESSWGDDGMEVLLPTPWLMKEYRLNKGSAGFRAAAARAQAHPWANMDCVVRKVFAMLPPQFGRAVVWHMPSSRHPGGGGGGGGGEEAGYASDKESRTRSASAGRVEEEPGMKRARLV